MSRALIERYRHQILFGPITRTLVSLGAPLTLSALGRNLLYLVDGIWLSRLRASYISIPWIYHVYSNLFMCILLLFTVPAQAIISQYIGRGDRESAGRAISFYLTTAILIGLALLVLLIGIAPLFLLYVVSVPRELYQQTLIYTTILALGIPMATLNRMLMVSLYSMGDTRTPAYLATLAAVYNMVLDPILMFGFTVYIPTISWPIPLSPSKIITLKAPALGVVGAALACIISDAIVLAHTVPIALYGFKWLNVKLSLRMVLQSKDLFIKTLKVGSMPSISFAASSLALVIFTRLIAQVGGVTALTAFRVSMYIAYFIDALIVGFNSAIVAMVGQNLGAKNIDRAEKTVWSALLLLTILAIVIAVPFYIFSSNYIEFFGISRELGEEGVVVTRTLLALTPIILATRIFVAVSTAIGRGSGHTRIPSILSMMRVWSWNIASSILIPTLQTVSALWYSMAIGNSILAIAAVVWISKGSWKKPIV